MRYVIIGGSGFVGQELISLLQSKAQKNIVVLDIVPSKLPVEYVAQDITKEIHFKFSPDDVVVHLAARQYHHKVPRQNRADFFESVNVSGTENILRKMKQDGAHRMIFLSTDMVYGRPLYLPIDVQHVQNPFGYYGISKKKAEEICLKYRLCGMNITIFRPRMIVGKGRMGILAKLFKLIKHHLPVPMIGRGQNCYQMVSVKDCARAVVLAIEHQIPNKAYHLGSYVLPPPNTLTVRRMLRQIIQTYHSKSILIPTWGRGLKIILAFLGKCGLEFMYKEQYMIADENYILDISETEKDLGWKPQFNDVEMMSAAYEEYLKNKEHL